MFTVIAFDIVDDRTRYRLVQALREYSVRVQKSVFEAAMLTPRNFERLRQKVERIIDLRVDHVRYYFLCRSCRDRLHICGRGSATVHEEYKVV
jgi:CRISPR-associated protein Cas2